MSEHQATVNTDSPPTFEIRLSSDKLKLYVTAPDPHADLAGTAARIAMELPAMELAVEIGPDVLVDLLAQACEPGAHLVDFPLLTGDFPEPPRDGEVQWQDDFFADGFAVDEDHDKVDYWERAENRAVSEGQLVAVVLTPLEGKPGRTLQGNEVAVAKPKNARIRPGKGVRTEEQDDRILVYAAVAGRIQNKDGNVSVDDVYLIRGDVGLATGNITHSGAVVVQGDVKEGARIQANGDVMVKGMVEPADIVCSGNLTVGGGVVGDGEHSLEVTGDLQARYLNDVHLRCGGDVNVISQIDHSDVACRGRVNIPKGRIAGGTVQGLKGIRVGHAGSPGATGTTLIAGSDYLLEIKHEERRKRMARLQEAREKITEAVARVVAHGTPNAEGQKLLDTLKAKSDQVDAAMKAEVEEQTRDAEDVIRNGVREVAVLIDLWAGVLFKIGSSQKASDRNYDKPRLVALRRDKVRILPMGELNTPD